ncbi:sensor histidine kinase [Streptomyces sp. NPDC091387]|uniref:sensor histidine kinase n=1 Tax=Streptomyces sp. NPDC091387 TaxID=3365998 RepID=UPI0037F6D56A
MLTLDETVWSECEQQARNIVADCQRAIHEACTELPASQLDAEFASMELGARRALAHIPAADSLRAARILKNVVLDAVPGMLAGMPAELALPRMYAAVKALHHAIDTRVEAAVIGYDAFLMRGVNRITTAQGSRLARDIHDRIGSSLSLALRYLELHELEQGRPEHAPDRVASARSSLFDTFGFVRDLVSGLRAPQMTASLHAQLEDYTAVCCPAGTEVDIQVRGDIKRLTSFHRDEVFLVARECLRNAFTHANASAVRVLVTVATHVLDVRITDNGKGICGSKAGLPQGNGLTAMRERIDALGGTLAITSPGGRGTSVRFRIPLSTAGYAARVGV